MNSRSGQSLVEVVIGLAIGAVLMGTAAFAVTTMLRTNLTSEKSQFASRFAQSLSDNVRSFAGGNWNGIYGLTKGTGSHYFLNSSGTTFFVVQGEEGMQDGEVTDGLVGHWKFDEIETTTSTTTYDAMGTGNHGTLTNGPTRATSTCKIGNCIDFDGTDDYIQVADAVALEPSFITVAAWFMTTNNALNQRIVSKTEGGSYQLSLNEGGPSTCGTSSLCFLVWVSGVGYRAATSSVSEVSNNTWHHVTGTYDGANVKLYLNGMLLATTAQAGSEILDTTTPFCIGAESTTGSCAGGLPFNGNLDDIRVYDRALSADEVRQLSNSGVYERFFTVENVCRTNDASSTIASTAPCSGTAEDGSTQWITSYTQWTTGAGTSELTLPTIVARWQNAVFRQTDWSGGAASEGAVAEPTSNFSSSTNASTTGGAIQIENLSQE